MNTGTLNQDLSDAIANFQARVDKGEDVAIATRKALEDFRESIVLFLKRQD